MKTRRVTRVVAVAAVALVAAAPMASAHVTVNPGEAPRGGYAALAFRVPNERADASTTTLEVNLPEDHPISSVRVRPTPGWTHTVETRTLDEPLESHGREVTEVVSKITWTGGDIGAGEYEEFNVSAGPLPEDADQLVFPSLQTYDDGEVVRWIDEPVEDDEEEPERPAPVLTLVDAEDGHGGGGDDSDDSGDDESAGLAVENTASQDDVDSANMRATVAIVLAVVGVVLAVLARRGARRRPAGD